TNVWNVAVIADLAPGRRRIRWCALRWRAQVRHVERIALVKIPIFFRRAKRQMRFQETDREKERLETLAGGAQSQDGVIRAVGVRISVLRHIGGFVRGAAWKTPDIIFVGKKCLLSSQARFCMAFRQSVEDRFSAKERNTP